MGVCSNPRRVSYQGDVPMSVKGRKSRQVQHESMDRGHTLKVVFKPRRAVDSEHFPFGKVWGTWRARQLLADTFAQALVDTAGVEEEGCARCGLEPHAWKGNK